MGHAVEVREAGPLLGELAEIGDLLRRLVVGIFENHDDDVLEMFGGDLRRGACTAIGDTRRSLFSRGGDLATDAG